MAQTLDQVIVALTEIVEKAKTQKARFGYFASLYLAMTQSVKAGISANRFQDGPRMERLVVIFANRYLNAFNQWQTGHTTSTAWKIAFDQTKLNNLTVIQHLLCGINAHINLDLSVAAAQTAPGSAIETLKTDFYTINAVIGSLLDKIQLKLNKISWPMRWLDRIGKNTDEQIANFGIGMARDAAWKEAKVLAHLDNANQTKMIQTLDATTTALGRLIINPGMGANLLLKPVKWFEPSDVRQIIVILNEK